MGHFLLTCLCHLVSLLGSNDQNIKQSHKMIKVCILYNFLDLVLNCKVKLWFRVCLLTLSYVLLKYILRHFNVTTPRLDDNCAKQV